MKFSLWCLLLPLLLLPGLVSAAPGPRTAEFTDGRIRLTLHEETGRFSLYYQNDLSREDFEPLFVDQDPRTSFISIILNDKSYRLGESSAFRFHRETDGEVPAFSFESSFLKVGEEFSFIKTAGSSVTNGIQITFQVENRGAQEISLGLRFLLDTSLGERTHGVPPFLTDVRPLESETLITVKDEDRWWISRNDRLSLMGSLSDGVERRPDQVHFANWKRLNEVPWKTAYAAGRNFNYLPYSINDSAVCYYFEPRLLSRGDTAVYTVLLAVEDSRGFVGGARNGDLSRPPRETVPLPVTPAPAAPATAVPVVPAVPVAPAAPAAPAGTKEADMILLRELISRIDRYMAGEIVITGEDLAAMEAEAARLKARYGLP
jgi:hypothetical protein